MHDWTGYPTNVSAIFRSAAALCIDAVLLTPACSDPLYRRSIRVSLGTVFQVPWIFLDSDSVKWPEQGMEFLHSLGFKSVAMALNEDSLSIEDLALWPSGSCVIGIHPALKFVYTINKKLHPVFHLPSHILHL